MIQRYQFPDNQKPHSHLNSLFFAILHGVILMRHVQWDYLSFSYPKVKNMMMKSSNCTLKDLNSSTILIIHLSFYFFKIDSSSMTLCMLVGLVLYLSCDWNIFCNSWMSCYDILYRYLWCLEVWCLVAIVTNRLDGLTRNKQTMYPNVFSVIVLGIGSIAMKQVVVVVDIWELQSFITLNNDQIPEKLQTSSLATALTCV